MSVTQCVVGVSHQNRSSSRPESVTALHGLTESAEIPRSTINGSHRQSPLRSSPVSAEENPAFTPVFGHPGSLNQTVIIQAARKAFSPLPPLKEE